MNSYQHNKSDYSSMMPKAISDFEKSIATIIFLCIDSLEFGVGINKLVHILTGTQTKFITDHNIQKNPAYSLLKQFSRNDLKEVIEILEMMDYISKENVKWDIDVLCLSGKAYAFLEGKENLEASFIDPITKNDFIELDELQTEHYEALRKQRYVLAQNNGIPAYSICNDKALRLMAINCPVSQADLLEINGIGPVFVEKYSDEFLDVINRFVEATETEDDYTEENKEEKMDEASKPIEQEPNESCKNCMLYRADECIGEKKICDFYKPSPVIPRWEIENWPEGTGGRMWGYYRR